MKEEDLQRIAQQQTILDSFELIYIGEQCALFLLEEVFFYDTTVPEKFHLSSNILSDSS